MKLSDLSNAILLPFGLRTYSSLEFNSPLIEGILIKRSSWAGSFGFLAESCVSNHTCSKARDAPGFFLILTQFFILKCTTCIAKPSYLSWGCSIGLYGFYGATGARKWSTKWKILAQRIQLLLCICSCAASDAPGDLQPSTLAEAACKGRPSSCIKCQVV